MKFHWIELIWRSNGQTETFIRVLLPRLRSAACRRTQPLALLSYQRTCRWKQLPLIRGCSPEKHKELLRRRRSSFSGTRRTGNPSVLEAWSSGDSASCDCWRCRSVSTSGSKNRFAFGAEAEKNGGQNRRPSVFLNERHQSRNTDQQEWDPRRRKRWKFSKNH